MSVKVLILLIIGIWIGLLIGISFIEAPLKFQAPGITTELGVGIGRIVFNFSNKVQLVLLIILLASFFNKRVGFDANFTPMLTIVTVVMLIQTFYFLPILDERVSLVLRGQEPSVSFHHFGFIIGELIKLITLIVLFIRFHSHA